MKANFPYLQVNGPWGEAPEQPLPLFSDTECSNQKTRRGVPRGVPPEQD